MQDAPDCSKKSLFCLSFPRAILQSDVSWVPKDNSSFLRSGSLQMTKGGASSPSLVLQHTNFSKNLREEVEDAPIIPVVPDG
uniref:Uncharacterized protein n=1 Tax=Arundo donax TaxID=35708 RepID=A0A0A9GJD6_ARUDO